MSLIDRIHKLIYWVSLLILGITIPGFILGSGFFNFYRDIPVVESIFNRLVLVVPFAPLGTLFGTLKEEQTVRKKLLILMWTGISVIVLLLLIWGSMLAAAFDGTTNL